MSLHRNLDRSYKQRMLVWDTRFQVRRHTAYDQEDIPLYKPINPQGLVKQFISARINLLHPPEYSHLALQRFLEKTQLSELGVENELNRPSSRLALIDDRRDPNQNNPRDWEEYMSHPPVGLNVDCSIYNAQELYEKLLEKVCLTRICFLRPLAAALEDIC